MAGGTFKSFNKVRPGAYINFKDVSKKVSGIGTRGIVTMPIALGWGASVIELLSSDLLDGKSLPKIGFDVYDEESQVVREALRHCAKAIIYRLDAGGVKATGSILPLSVTAKYAGVVGNQIAVSVVANGAKFDIVTSYKGLVKDKQTVSTVAELEDNAWVDFSGTGNVVANAGVTLAGGTNGSVEDTNYANYLNVIKAYNWNTMGIPSNSASAKTSVIMFIMNMRENLGKKVQAVLFNADADYEGIISVSQGYATPEEIVAPQTFVAYIAGLTAGSEANKSNTYHEVVGATSIVYPDGVTPYGDEEIQEALQSGKLVISTRHDGVVVIEQDINTLHTYPEDKSYNFSKNRVIRTLDEINNSLSLMFQRSYIGKVDRTDDGLNVFKADVINYLNTLQNISAIQNFNSESDVQLMAGEALDSVIANLAVQPVDSMEKLYMTVMVG